MIQSITIPSAGIPLDAGPGYSTSVEVSDMIEMGLEP